MKKQLLTIVALCFSYFANAQVGIGTTTPTEALDVETSNATKTAIDINNTSTGDPKINFQLNSTTNFSIGIDNSDADKLKIGTSAPETNTRLTIDNTGNVGVGTTSPVSTLDIQGSMGYKVTSITAATTLNASHNVLLCNNGPYTVTLPAAAANTNRVYRIKNVDPQGDIITINANASETIEGVLTYALQPYKYAITIISDGANWHIIDDLDSPVGYISSISCGSATNDGLLISGIAASGVSSVIPYTNGNAGPHNGQVVSSTGVTGLTATLAAGTFVAGNGNLTFTISGTPASSGTATFALNIGGQTCNLTRTVGAASSGGTAVVSTWTSTIGCAVGAGTNNSPAGVRRAGVNQTLVDGIVAPATASITLVANVTTTGTYNITTNSLNGVTFSASGTFGATGNQTVTLTPSGTPTSAGNYKWVTTLTPSIEVYGSVLTANAPLGSSYTSHRNGIINGVHVGTTYLSATQTTGETFNNNGDCDTKPISAQGCGGVSSVTAASGRAHLTVNINGQCWLKTNLITVPSVFSTYTTGSWTNTSPGDQGYWGYYNTSTSSGSAGWQSSEPATNEGLLYQWCGAMNATISERSRGICPEGFHVPSDCEWMYLEHGQGMSIANQIATGLRANTNNNQGTPGYKLRSDGTAFTNASGFSGMLSGWRGPDGSYSYRNSEGSFWTSTILSTTSAYCRDLWDDYMGVYRVNTNTEKSHGLSVRCLKD